MRELKEGEEDDEKHEQKQEQILKKQMQIKSWSKAEKRADHEKKTKTYQEQKQDQILKK